MHPTLGIEMVRATSRNRAARSRQIRNNLKEGEHYDVDGNSDYYWVNNDGGYIGTDNSLFDPRQNQLTKDEDWTMFHKERQVAPGRHDCAPTAAVGYAGNDSTLAEQNRDTGP